MGFKNNCVGVLIGLLWVSSSFAETEFKLQCYTKPNPGENQFHCSKAMGECQRAEADFINYLEEFASNKIKIQYELKRNLKLNISKNALIRLSRDKQSNLAPVLGGPNVCIPIASKIELKNKFSVGNEINQNSINQACGPTFRLRYLGGNDVDVDMSNPNAREWSYLAGARSLSTLVALEKIKEQIKSKRSLQVPVACEPYFDEVLAVSKKYEEFLHSYSIADVCDVNSGLIEGACGRQPASANSVNDGEPRQCYMQMARNTYEHSVHVAADCALHQMSERIFLERTQVGSSNMDSHPLVKLGKEIGAECKKESNATLLTSNEKITEEIQKCYDKKLELKIKEKIEALFPEIKDIKFSNNTKNKNSLPVFAFAGLFLGKRRKRKLKIKSLVIATVLLGLVGCGGDVYINNPACMHDGMPIDGDDFRDQVKSDIENAMKEHKPGKLSARLDDLQRNKWEPRAAVLNKKLGLCCKVSGEGSKIANLENCGGQNRSCVTKVGTDVSSECPGYVSVEGPPYIDPIDDLADDTIKYLSYAGELMPKRTDESKREIGISSSKGTAVSKDDSKKQAAIQGLSRSVQAGIASGSDTDIKSRTKNDSQYMAGNPGVMKPITGFAQSMSGVATDNTDVLKVTSDEDSSGQKNSDGDSDLIANVDGAVYQSAGGGSAADSNINKEVGFNYDFSELSFGSLKKKITRNSDNKDHLKRDPASLQPQISTEDYFLLTSANDDLFKIVESRYRTKWVQFSHVKDFK